MTKKYFEDLGLPAVEERPLLFTSFMQATADDQPMYAVVPSYDTLKKVRGVLVGRCVVGGVEETRR